MLSWFRPRSRPTIHQLDQQVQRGRFVEVPRELYQRIAYHTQWENSGLIPYSCRRSYLLVSWGLSTRKIRKLVQ